MACRSSRWKYRSPIQLYILVLLTDTTLGLQCSLDTSTDLGPKDGFMDSGNPQSAIVSLVRNVSITASSHKAGFEPWRVRITDDIEVNSLAWCPITKVHMDSYEWVQIDFEDQKNITLIQTKGNFDEADGREYTPKFRLEFSRGIDGGFTPYMNKNGQQIFTGNSDTSNTKLNTFNPPIIARRIRIVPLANIPTDVCIQAMFAGCNLDTGIELYTTTPQATAVLNSVSYSDILSDQDRRNYGPGKLADATVYNSSSTTWLREYGVAFSPDSSDTVVLEITLDNYRLLKEVFIVGVQTDVLNGLFQLKIFDEARLFFAAPSKTSYVFLSSTSPRLDTDSQYQISIFNSNQRENKVVTRFLKIEMDFSVVRDVKQNLLLHEVKIMSVNANSSTPTTGSPEGQSGTPEGQSGNNSQKTTAVESFETLSPIWSGGATTTKEDTKPVNSTVIGIIIGACLLVIMIVIVVIVVCYFYQRRKNGQDTPPESPSFTAHSNGNSSSGSDKGENSFYGHGVPWSRPLPHVPSYHQTTPLHQPSSSGYVSDGAHYDCIPVDGSRLPPNMYTTSELMKPCIACQTLTNSHPQPHTRLNKRNKTLPNYPQHMNGHSAAHRPGVLCGDGSCQPYDVVQAPGNDCQPFDGSNYRSNPVNTFPQIQGASGTSLYGTSHSVKIQQSLNSQQIELDEIPPNNLAFLELIGKGQHGEVHLARYTPSLHPSRERLVAVKSLITQAGETTKQDFYREIRIMSRLNHDNIIKVLGLCSRDGTANSAPQCVVSEYMCKGDLHQFLKQYKPESETFTGDEHKEILSRGCLLHISAQIADGMRYLEELNVTHRDLAARNCLVGENYQVKISDFGMSRSLYSQQYYKLEGQMMLPIRWMSWESVVHGRFTLKSDSWSFGVLLWEIFTFCREQPYSQLTDEQVISNCMRISEVYYNRAPRDTVVKLHQPNTCSKEMYDLWMACWAPFESARPPFHEIALFLKRKNLGYNPLDEHNLHRLTSI